jgi:hypothetical protein
VLEVAFDRPVVAVAVRFRAPRGAPTLRAFDERGRLVAQSGAAVAVDSAGTQAIGVSGPVLARIAVSVTFGELHAICRLALDDACAGDGWEEVRHLRPLDPPGSVSEAEALIRKELGPGTWNRYAADLDDAVERYRDGVIPLLEWLWALRDPDGHDSTGRPRIKKSAGVPPSGWALAGGDEKSSLREVRAQALLLLAALDPNIARLLRLAWVDRDVDYDDKGDVYDYKVEGVWPETRLCGVALEVGRAVADLPRLSSGAAWQASARADALPGVRWERREPRRRVGVRWPRPPGPTEHGAPTRAVLFDVTRRDASAGGSSGVLHPAPGGDRDPTTRQRDDPVLVPASAWAADGRTPCLVDGEVPLGRHAYRVCGIDLFGQVGHPSPAIDVDVQDVEGPPPPVRLAARLDQPGYPWRTPQERAAAGPASALHVAFEYGALQDLHAPDVAEFVIYWRPRSLTESRPAVTVGEVTALPTASNGSTAYSGKVTGLTASELARFAGGTLSRRVPVQTTAGPSVKQPKVAERRHWRIARLEAATGFFETAPSDAPLANGTYRLTSDPHDRAGWSELARVDARPPVVGDVRSVATTRAVGFRLIPDPPLPADPLDRLPAGRRPVELPPPATVEVSIAQALLEPDVFAGATVTIDGEDFTVVASTPGVADEGSPEGPPPRSARLRLEPVVAGTPVPSSGTLTLRVPPHPDPAAQSPASPGGAPLRAERGALRWLVLGGVVPAQARAVSGGELGFTLRQEAGEPRDEGGRAIVAQVLSPAEPSGGTFRVLARFPASQTAADVPAGGRYDYAYYAPYAKTVALAVVAGDGPIAPDQPRLDLGADEGAVSAYVAVASTDHRRRAEAGAAPHDPRWDQNLGPLSAPVQVVAVRPPPRVVPAAPFPRGLPPGPGTEPADGYATPPDPEGRATVSLEWAPLPGPFTYEVGRAMDEGVIQTARRRWLSGAASGSPDVEDGPSFDDDVAEIAGSVAPRPGGVFDVRLVDAVSGLPLETDPELVPKLVGGRLVQQGARFQVTAATLTDDALVATLRPLRPSDAPEVGACAVAGAPLYDAIREQLAGRPPDVPRNGSALRRLADVSGNEEAFAVVTGAPVDATRFIDQVPGRGQSAFFYRVRGVDPAGHRTAWSPTSAAFWQADTTPPAPPGSFRAFAGPRSVLLSWAASFDPTVTGYRVYRLADGGEPRDPALATEMAVPRDAIGPRRPTVVAGTVSVPPRPAGAIAELTIVRTIPAGDDGPNLFVAPERLSMVEGRRIVSLNPLVPDGTAVAVRLGDPASPTVLTHRPGSGAPLVVAGGAVDVGFDLDVQAIESLLPAAEVAAGEPPESSLALPSLLDLAEDATVDLDALTISGLEGAVPDGLAVAALVRLAAGSLRVIRHAPGGLEPLRVSEGTVRLDRDEPLDTVRAVIAVVGPLAAASRSGAPPDLRLTEPSALRVDPADGRITGVTGLNPFVANGTEVVVTFVAADGQASVYEGDPSMLAWRDTELGAMAGDPPVWTWRDAEAAGIPTYAYFLAAVRRVTTGRAVGGPPVERAVRGGLTGPVFVTPLDRSAGSP